MKTKTAKISSRLFIIAAILLSLTVNISAQNRKKDLREKKAKVKYRKEVTVKHDVMYKEILVKKKHYFYREGYFYDRRPEGYVKIVAPIGARIRLLPHGYKIVRVHRAKYYLYAGVYYRLIPRERVYVVVNTPL